MADDNKPGDKKPTNTETNKPKPASPHPTPDPKKTVELRNVQESTHPPKGKFDAG